jgi:hypothetical protein
MRLLLSALFATCALSACAEPADETPRVYVVDVLRMPEPVDGVAVGADHDGMDAGDGTSAAGARCDLRHADYRSEHDGTPGLDASFNQLVGTIDGLLEEGRTLDDELAERIASGELLIALEVVGGPPRTVAAYLVEPAGELAVGAGGRLEPDQAFVVTAELGTGSGEGAGDRVAARLGDFSEVVPLIRIESFALLPVPWRSVELRFDDDGARLGRGELGALIDAEELIAALPPPTDPSLPEDGYDVIRELADVAPTADDPSRCTYVSLGLAFEAVAARLER